MKTSAWPGIFDGSTALTIYWSYDASGKQTAAWWSNAGQSVHQQPLVDGYTFDYTGSSGTTWAVETTDLPNGTLETVTHNDRMQPRQRRLTNPSVVWLLDYDFTDGAGKNNGDVWGIDEGSPGYTSNRNQTFSYDWLNRIKTANVSGQWGLSFSFDRWGNRMSQSSTSGNPATNVLTFNQNRNRITTTGSNSYDYAGNLLACFGQTWQYDAENRIKTVNGGSTATYSYDGDGRRAKRVGDGETRYYFHDPDGNPIWEYKQGVGWEAFNFYFNGKHLVVNNTTEGLRWRHQDHLGSLRVKTDSTGAVKCRYWYYPYGEPWNSTCSEKDARRFTDKERDPESGLDYFGARYYASAHGRFSSVDPAVESGRLEDPQTWNRYIYTSNNPVNRADLDGRIWFVKDGEEPVWVEPGGAAPGEGWTAVEGDFTRVLGDQVIRYGVRGDGSPFAYPQEEGLIDNTFDLVLLAQTVQVGAQLIKGGLSILRSRAAAKATMEVVGETQLRKNMIVAGYRVTNHVARKSGTGRGATVELVEATIEGARKAGTVVTDTATRQFEGNQILKFVHRPVTVVVDETRKTILSVRGAGLNF